MPEESIAQTSGVWLHCSLNRACYKDPAFRNMHGIATESNFKTLDRIKHINDDSIAAEESS
jgi:hypothetical protein